MYGVALAVFVMHVLVCTMSMCCVSGFVVPNECVLCVLSASRGMKYNVLCVALLNLYSGSLLCLAIIPSFLPKP